MISAQPSAASAAWSSSVPVRRDHDQPEPILCHSTGPPSPVSACRRPSAPNAVSSPTFHLALLTNWKTPIDQPCVPPAQREPERGRRLALHLSRVDDDERTVAALTGTQTVGGDDIRASLRHQAAPRTPAHDRHEGVGRELVEAQRHPVQDGREITGQPEPHRPGLAVDDDARDPVRREQPGGALRVRDRVTGRSRARGPGGGVARPSVTTTSSGRRRGSRRRSTASTRRASSRPAASGVRPPVGSERSRAAPASTDDVGGRSSRAVDAPEGDRARPCRGAGTRRAAARGPRPSRRSSGSARAIEPDASTQNSTRFPSRPSRTASRRSPARSTSPAPSRPRARWYGRGRAQRRRQVQRAEPARRGTARPARPSGRRLRARAPARDALAEPRNRQHPRPERLARRRDPLGPGGIVAARVRSTRRPTADPL